MAKKGAKAMALSGRERRQGIILLGCYMVVFPVIAGRVFDLAEFFLGLTMGKPLRDALYYFVLFVLTLAVFGNFWKRSTRVLFSDAKRVFASLGLGAAAFYGLNVVSTLLLRSFQPVNLNDAAISDRLAASPGITVLIVVFLAPAVEETLFRGYVFGALREYSRAGAYVFSCLLWALAHVWQYAAGDWSYLLMAAQYAAPGLVMAWTYERAGCLWGSIFLHGVVNAIAVGSVL